LGRAVGMGMKKEKCKNWANGWGWNGNGTLGMKVWRRC